MSGFSGGRSGDFTHSMSDSAGKRLSQARLKRGLTIDEAAHATKMRPDKILALENDDLSRFGSNAYAKGFLLLYARFLHVDVEEETRALDVPHDLRVRDYQYLSNAAPPAAEPIQRFSSKPKTPSVVPLVVAAGLIIVLVFGFYLRVTAQRLGLGETAVAATTPAPKVAPALVSTPVPVVKATVPAATPMPAPEAAVAVAEPAPEIRRAEPVVKITAADGDVVNEVLIAAKKKTWVQVRRDDPKSTPIFVDYLYPNDPPLKLRGARFYVEAREPDLIAIRKNGEPVEYAAGQPIQ